MFRFLAIVGPVGKEATQETFESVERQLAEARGLEEVQRVVKTAARRLADSQGATIVLLEDDRCYYADEDSMSPLWKGQRFPASACISGWAMMHREAVTISDIRTDERIPQAAYRPTFVRSLVMVPILGPEPLGAIGVYWAQRSQPADAVVKALQRLAALAATALRRFPDGVADPSFGTVRSVFAR